MSHTLDFASYESLIGGYALAPKYVFHSLTMTSLFGLSNHISSKSANLHCLAMPFTC